MNIVTFAELKKAHTTVMVPVAAYDEIQFTETFDDTEDRPHAEKLRQDWVRGKRRGKRVEVPLSKQSLDYLKDEGVPNAIDINANQLEAAWGTDKNEYRSKLRSLLALQKRLPAANKNWFLPSPDKVYIGPKGGKYSDPQHKHSLKKSEDDLSKAAHKLQGRLDFQGMQISIENRKGSKRHWGDPHSGESGTTLMRHPYGYIRMTEGTDGDHVDVYVGPNRDSRKVYVVNQMKKPDFKKFDEQKVMLGFDTAKAAKTAYLIHYNDDRFLGEMFLQDIGTFKEKVYATKDGSHMVGKATGNPVCPAGRCYPWAYSYMKERPGGTMYHGTMVVKTDPSEREHGTHKRIDHAWVEHEGKVKDWQTTGRGPFGLSIEQFNEQHKPERHEKFESYDAAIDTAVAWNKKHGGFHTGPWHDPPDKVYIGPKGGKYSDPERKHSLKKARGGPYIGPRGGKWEDPKHTIPWKKSKPKKKPKPQSRKLLMRNEMMRELNSSELTLKRARSIFEEVESRHATDPRGDWEFLSIWANDRVWDLVDAEPKPKPRKLPKGELPEFKADLPDPDVTGKEQERVWKKVRAKWSKSKKDASWFWFQADGAGAMRAADAGKSVKPVHIEAVEKGKSDQTFDANHAKKSLAVIRGLMDQAERVPNRKSQTLYRGLSLSKKQMASLMTDTHYVDASLSSWSGAHEFVDDWLDGFGDDPGERAVLQVISKRGLPFDPQSEGETILPKGKFKITGRYQRDRRLFVTLEEVR